MLHTLYLGVMVIWCQTTIWATIACKIWADCGDENSRAQVICLRMRGELFQSYQRRKQEHRNEPLTELTDFSPNMIGTSHAPKLTTKASETWGCCCFYCRSLKATKQASETSQYPFCVMLVCN
jgi:hypothetical protein